MSQQKVGMIFGGRSVEHEVSVLTAHQAMAALPRDRYQPVPLYIAKDGQWYHGEPLRNLDNFRDLGRIPSLAEPVIFSANANQPGFLIQRVGKRGLFGGNAPQFERETIDVAFPLIHGTHGEDGTLQGLLELADLPYVGCDVPASAIAIDKALTKRLLRSAGLPVLPEQVVGRQRWRSARAEILSELNAAQPFPLFVKPARLGSSIGVSRAENQAELEHALDVALTYDERALVEPAQAAIIEINCAVLGLGEQARASVCEQPISSGTLSYEDKYLRGGKGKGAQTKGMQSAQRLIPAPISPSLSEAIQAAALAAFRAIGAAGVTRIDFLVRPDEERFFINEMNTLPGSLAFYLWEASGLSFQELLQELIEQGRQRHREKQASTFTFASSLLQSQKSTGSKR